MVGEKLDGFGAGMGGGGGGDEGGGGLGSLVSQLRGIGIRIRVIVHYLHKWCPYNWSLVVTCGHFSCSDSNSMDNSESGRQPLSYVTT